MILSISNFLDDARENYQSAAAKKKDLLKTLVAAGLKIRENAMMCGPRGRKRARLENVDGNDGWEKAARGAAVLQDSDDASSAADVDANPSATTPKANAGPAEITPACGRTRRSPEGGESDEMELMIAADEREEKKLKNEQERLAIDREGLQTRRKDLELRREQQALAKLETEARIKLDIERAEEEKKARAEDRAERKQQAEENAKVLTALVNLLGRENFYFLKK